MRLDEARTCLTVFENTPENIKRSAQYLSKDINAQNITDSMHSMKIETLLTYLRAYDGLRKNDCSGIFRNNEKHTKEELKAIKDSVNTRFKEIIIPRDFKPTKIYEFETQPKSNDRDVTAK